MRYNTRIFQLYKEPVKSEQYIKVFEFELNNTSLQFEADHIEKERDREKSIGLLMADFGGYGGASYNKRDDSIYFPKGFREEFFWGRLQGLKTQVGLYDRRPFIPFEDLITQRFGPYICTEDSYGMTLDEFFSNLEEDRKYYVGGILRYYPPKE